MAITDPNSVLILGAGVSAPFGLPLGGALIDEIAEALTAERGRIYTKEDWGGSQARSNYMYSARDLEAFFKAPIYGAMGRKHLQPDGRELNWAEVDKDANRLVALRDLLRDQTSETIDDFIVENSGYADLTKIAIAALLLRKCYGLQNNDGIKSWGPNKFAAREYSGERNWIHLLINIIRHGIRKKEITPDRKITIITFNYDRVLEFVLEKQFSNTEAKHPHYSTFVDILHVHGCFSPIEDTPRDFAQMTLECASGIHVVNEPNIPLHIQEIREKARAAIAVADEIYSVGFSFAGPNCKLIGLTDIDAPRAPRKKFVRFCNYNGNVGVKRSAESLAGDEPLRIVVEEAAGTVERVLSASDWLKSGHLGELPG